MGFWSKLFGGDKAEQAPETKPEDAGTKGSPKEVFVAWCIAEIVKHPHVKHAQAVAGHGLPVAIRMRDGSEQKMYLGNTFSETRDHSPEQRLAALRRLFSGLDQQDRKLEWEGATGSFVPLLRAATFGGSVLSDEISMVSRPCLPFLSVFLGLDDDVRINYTTQKDLESWGQSAEVALAHAYVNMQVHVDAAPNGTPDVAPYDEDSPFPIWHVVRDDSYESSRLLLPGYLAKFRDKVSGNPIAIVPHRSLLVIAGDAEPEAVARLAQMAEKEFKASPRSVSPAIYTVDGAGQVVPLRLPPEHPQHQRAERGHYLLALNIYGEQKTVLEPRFEKQGVELFVATYMLLKKAGSEKLFSTSTMTKGVPSLLPETDTITLVGGSEQPFTVPRAALLELAPECFEAAPEYYPPRLRTVGWPEPDKLAELQRLAAAS